MRNQEALAFRDRSLTRSAGDGTPRPLLGAAPLASNGGVHGAVIDRCAFLRLVRGSSCRSREHIQHQYSTRRHLVASCWPSGGCYRKRRAGARQLAAMLQCEAGVPEPRTSTMSTGEAAAIAGTAATGLARARFLPITFGRSCRRACTTSRDGKRRTTERAFLQSYRLSSTGIAGTKSWCHKLQRQPRGCHMPSDARLRSILVASCRTMSAAGGSETRARASSSSSSSERCPRLSGHCLGTTGVRSLMTRGGVCSCSGRSSCEGKPK